MSPEPTRTDRPMFVIEGDATEEEVAALVAVLQGIASAPSSSAPDKPRSEWSAGHRKVRSPLSSGPGGWRSSAMPR